MKARCFGLVVLPLAFTLAPPAFAGPEEPIAQLTPILQEGIERRLIQFEVRLSQKGAPVRGVKAADLDIELGGKPLKSFILDDMCSGAPGVTVSRPGSFILYFDEIELTFDGRRRAVEVAKLVANTLLAQGHEILIVRNRTALQTESGWTHDAAVVAAALARIAGDPGAGDAMRAAIDQARVLDSIDHADAVLHDANLAQVTNLETSIREALNGPVIPGAASCGLPTRDLNPAVRLFREYAKTYEKAGDQVASSVVNELGGFAREEVRRGERDLARLRAAISTLASRGAPKGIVYFADTLQRDPGHVVEDLLQSDPQFANRIQDGVPRLQTKATLRRADARLISSVSSRTADLELAALVRDASAYGARFFAVEGRDLAATSDWIQASQDTMVSLALDTGGLPFLNGIAPAKIADRIAADQSCWYLASFDPRGWAADKPLGLGVYPKARGVRVHTRSSLVIPSRETLIQAKLLADHVETPVDREAIALKQGQDAK